MRPRKRPEGIQMAFDAHTPGGQCRSLYRILAILGVTAMIGLQLLRKRLDLVGAPGR